jgi:outer membrane receptor for ferrienterochelin and colicins
MKKAAILALTALTFSTAHAYAQAVTPDEFALDEVVVTATKTDMKKKAVPASVEVISQEDIRARGAHTLKDVISTATSVSLNRSTGRDAISIRGFDSRFSMILIDGKRISSEIDQNYELDRISLENVERIEIVRGPVSSLYGTEAMGGVVNIITKRATEPAFSVSLDHGAFSGDRGAKDRYQFTYDSGIQGKTGVTISGSRLENNAVFKSNGTTYAPYGERENISARLDYQLSEKETVSLTAGYMNEDTREYAYKTNPSGVQIKTNINDNNERYEYSLSYNKQQAPNDSVFLRAYLSEYYKKLDVYNVATSKLMNFGDSHRTVPGFEARLTREAGPQHVLTYGGEYRPEKFRGTGVKTGQGIYSITRGGIKQEGSGIDLDYSALYVQDQWQVSPKLLAVTSLRYDDSSKFESNLSPKVGLTYEATPDSRLKLNVAKGFRSPTPNQLYINSSVNRNGTNITLLGNDQLQTEKSNSYELSLEQDWGKATGKLTYFVNKLDNMIDEVRLPSGNQLTYQNISQVTMQGVEAELSYPLSDTLSWSANYTNLDATNDEKNTRLVNRARHKLASRLSYNDHDSVRANLWCEFYSDFLYADVGYDSGKNKSYALWNVNLEKTLTKNHTLSVGVENLLNKKDDDLCLQGAFVHSEIRMKF